VGLPVSTSLVMGCFSIQITFPRTSRVLLYSSSPQMTEVRAACLSRPCHGLLPSTIASLPSVSGHSSLFFPDSHLLEGLCILPLLSLKE
jgi:hypothetical protein